ncbi:AAA family ATPase [Candidatus Falkowbacteria bacterium]|nr:AAA family ATPase [Candidatus Falkowbacteria bacterium]
MIISFGGNAGSGKSTIAQMLADKLGWPRYYIGGLRREKARERGLTLAEYNKLGETDPATDFEVDEYQKELAGKEDNFVIEGRTSWYFIPQSLKIFLTVDEKVGAERILAELKQANSRNEAVVETVEEMIAINRDRKESDERRYRKFYQDIEVYNPKNFNFVVDTTDLTPEQVFSIVYNHVQDQLSQVDKTQRML